MYYIADTSLFNLKGWLNIEEICLQNKKKAF